MRDLQLAAVGSSEAIAAEIKDIAASILDNAIPITIMTTEKIHRAEENTFYICATTQRGALEKIIPRGQLFVFELRPTTLFFLDIAKIPKGTDVYIFHNLSPYTALLKEECQKLGITGLTFHTIPYEEMSGEEIAARLQEARYIIGVECMVGENVLRSEKYRPHMRGDVKIIACKRAASTASASRLLEGIASFYCETFQKEREGLTRADGRLSENGALKTLSEKIGAVFTLLQTGASQVVTSQIIGKDAKLFKDHAATTEPSHTPYATVEYINGQLDALRYLQKKLAALASRP